MRQVRAVRRTSDGNLVRERQCGSSQSLLVCAALNGCATIEISKVTPNQSNVDGLRFYRPDLYLLVTADAADPSGKGLQTSVISLPNKNEEYILRHKSGIGSTELSATLEGGWNLTQLGTTVDTKVPETITGVAGVLGTVGGLAALRTSLALEPGLYLIEFDATSGQVKGLREINLQVPAGSTP